MTNPYVPGPRYGLSSGYGPRNPSQAGASKLHFGIDFRAPLGAPIPAAADGEVYYTGAASGYGLAVILKHTGADGAPYFTVYGHMNELPDLALGQKVTAGQEIGKVGNNGISSGPHLHFETVDGDTAFNHEINGTSTGVRGHVNRVNPDTFDFHGNTVFNGAGTPAAPAPSLNARPSTALLPNPPQSSQPPLSPGMPVPGAEGPTSLGGPNGPVPLVLPQLAPNQGKRSDIPGEVTPTGNDVAPDTPVRRLVNLSSPALPDAPPLVPTAAQPLLGISSGQTMPDWPVPPLVFEPRDQSPPEENELFQRWMRWLDR